MLQPEASCDWPIEHREVREGEPPSLQCYSGACYLVTGGRPPVLPAFGLWQEEGVNLGVKT